MSTDPQPDGNVQPLPAGVLTAIGRHAEALGGEYRERPEDAGCVGRTMFDLPSSEDNSVTVLLPNQHLGSLPSQALLRIRSRDGRRYIGVVVGGPFAEPDGLRGDAQVIVTTSVQGATFVPNFHGRVQVELMGEEVGEPGGPLTLAPPRFRPLPNSPVFPLGDAETAAMLRCDGDIRLGLAVGHQNVVVGIPSESKEVLPRHTGILGTTGGGKSTTVAGLIARMQAAGVATVLLDTEGEYTGLNEPTDHGGMLAALRRQGMRPAGVPGTQVFHLTGRDAANPAHPRLAQFCLWFCNLAPHMVAEVLELNDARSDRFLLAYEVARLLLAELGVFPRRDNRADEDAALNWDDQETGYPHLELSHLLDVVGAFIHVVSKADGDFQPYHRLFKTPEGQDKLLERVKPHSGQTSHPASWRAVRSRLFRLQRLRIFDREGVAHLPYRQMLQPGRVTSLWRRLPALAPGQAVVSLASMSRPLLVAVDPAGAKLRMVE